MKARARAAGHFGRFRPTSRPARTAARALDELEGRRATRDYAASLRPRLLPTYWPALLENSRTSSSSKKSTPRVLTVFGLNVGGAGIR